MSTFEFGNSRSIGNNTRNYPDPFRTHAASLMPRTVAELFKWCESVCLRNGTFSRALQRVVSYFITRISINEVSDKEKKRWDDLLNRDLKVGCILQLAGTDFLTYGNSVTSLFMPFKRLLRCDACKLELPIESVDFKFSDMKFEWKCTNCKKVCHNEKPIDKRINDPSKVKVKRWSPHEIRIINHPLSGRKIFLWDPPKDIAAKVKKGDAFYIRDYPWEMIEAICKDKLFEFADGIVHHMEEETLAGVNTGGWGMPPLMRVFEQAYYVQQAKMYNQVLMNEFMVPFRVISPAKAGGPTGDPLQSVNIGGFNSQIMGMINQHRRNPGGYYAVPVPIEYQALSGEGMQITTHEHINAAIDEMLNSAGVPAELYKGTLQFEVLPTALRLFQQTWPHLVTSMNGFLSFVAEQISVNFNWCSAKPELQPVTLADDIEKKQILMQLLAGNRISADTALSPSGIDPKEEIKKIMEEQKYQVETQQKFEEDMASKNELQQLVNQTTNMMAPPGQGGGQGGAEGDPAAQGQPAPAPFDSSQATPGDVLDQAAEEAQRLVTMPYEQRRSELGNLKKTNEQLHALVKAKMESIRGQAKSVGGQQVLAQQAQPPGS